MVSDPFAALRDEFPGWFASPERCAELANERFAPWPFYKISRHNPEPATPTDVNSWGVGATGMGFVRNERFGSGMVIPGTNRAKQRKDSRR